MCVISVESLHYKVVFSSFKYSIQNRGEQMKTVLNMLKEKLNTLGYNETISNTVLNKFDIALIENSMLDVENISDFIRVEEYEEPNIEIIRMFLNININPFHNQMNKIYHLYHSQNHLQYSNHQHL